jgi:predicted small metal-binding protein
MSVLQRFLCKTSEVSSSKVASTRVIYACNFYTPLGMTEEEYAEQLIDLTSHCLTEISQTSIDQLSKTSAASAYDLNIIFTKGSQIK